MNTRQHNCKEELQETELRATPARIAAMRYFEQTDKPADVQMLKTYLHKQKIKADSATVFRIVNTFTQKGLTKQIQLNENKFRYELADKIDHHHFICDNCGTIEDISDCNIEAIEKEINQKKGLLIKRHRLEFFGLCKSCQR